MNIDRAILLLVLNESIRNTHRLDTIMTSQENMTADVAALNDGLAQIEAEVASLKIQPAAAQLDLSRLDQVVARVRGDVPAVPAAPASTDTPAATPPADPAPSAPTAVTQDVPQPDTAPQATPPAA